jgi:hypothetical protein
MREIKLCQNMSLCVRVIWLVRAIIELTAVMTACEVDTRPHGREETGLTCMIVVQLSTF